MQNYSNLIKDVSVISFDLDDTLYNKSEFQVGAYRAICAFLVNEYHIDGEVFFKMLVDLSSEKYSNYPYLFEECLAEIGLNNSNVVGQCVDTYRAYKPPRLTLYPGVSETLSLLKQRYKLAMITNGYPPTQETKIKALQIGPYFAPIVYTHALGNKMEYRKPHPRSYELVLQQLGAAPENMLYVGDNPTIDFAGAVQLGVRCARVLSGEYHNMPLDPLLEKKVYVANDIKELFSEELSYVQ